MDGAGYGKNLGDVFKAAVIGVGIVVVGAIAAAYYIGKNSSDKDNDKQEQKKEIKVTSAVSTPSAKTYYM
jgi:hypothetical protein